MQSQPFFTKFEKYQKRFGNNKILNEGMRIRKAFIIKHSQSLDGNKSLLKLKTQNSELKTSTSPHMA
jgi:hypothetical protein